MEVEERNKVRSESNGTLYYLGSERFQKVVQERIREEEEEDYEGKLHVSLGLADCGLTPSR